MTTLFVQPPQAFDENNPASWTREPLDRDFRSMRGVEEPADAPHEARTYHIHLASRVYEDASLSRIALQAAGIAALTPGYVAISMIYFTGKAILELSSIFWKAIPEFFTNRTNVGTAVATRFFGYALFLTSSKTFNHLVEAARTPIFGLAMILAATYTILIHPLEGRVLMETIERDYHGVFRESSIIDRDMRHIPHDLPYWSQFWQNGRDPDRIFLLAYCMHRKGIALGRYNDPVPAGVPQRYAREVVGIVDECLTESAIGDFTLEMPSPRRINGDEAKLNLVLETIRARVRGKKVRLQVNSSTDLRRLAEIIINTHVTLFNPDKALLTWQKAFFDPDLTFEKLLRAQIEFFRKGVEKGRFPDPVRIASQIFYLEVIISTYERKDELLHKVEELGEAFAKAKAKVQLLIETLDVEPRGAVARIHHRQDEINLLEILYNLEEAINVQSRYSFN